MFLRCGVNNMPLSYWCYAVQMAVDLLNMREAYEGISMHESYYGTKRSGKYTLEFGQVALCKSTRAHAEKGGWSLNKNVFWGKIIGMHPLRANKFTVLASNGRVYKVSSIKAYPEMFSFRAVFKRYPSVLTSPVVWNGDAQPGGNASPGGSTVTTTVDNEKDTERSTS